MTAVVTLTNTLLRKNTPSTDATDLGSPSETAKVSKLSKVYALRNIVLPTFDKPIVIPNDTQVVMLGIPGLFSDYGGIKGYEDAIGGDGIYYYGAEFLHLMLTKHLTSRLPDLADAIVQKWQKPIDINTQSGGVHQGINIEVKRPGTTHRMYPVVGPYGVSLDKESRNRHTSLGPVIGVQTKPGFRRLFDQEAIRTYSEFIRGEDTPGARDVAAAIVRMEHAAFGASDDIVVDSETTRPPEGPNTRFFGFIGGHSDGAEQVGPIIRYLATRELHANIPEALALGRLLPDDHHFEFHQQKTGKIVLDHFGSHGEGRVLRTARSIYEAPETARNGRVHVLTRLHDFRHGHSPMPHIDPEMGRELTHAS